MPPADTELMSDTGVARFIATGVSDDQTLASVARERQAEAKTWDRFIDDYLLEWWRDSSALADVDFAPPSRDVIGDAIQLAKLWRDADAPAPSRMLPDGDGNIVFEREVGDFLEALEVCRDGTAELDTFEDCRHVGRVTWRLRR